MRRVLVAPLSAWRCLSARRGLGAPVVLALGLSLALLAPAPVLAETTRPAGGETPVAGTTVPPPPGAIVPAAPAVGDARNLPDIGTNTAILEPNKNPLFGQYGTDPYNYEEETGQPKTAPAEPEPLNFQSDLLRVVDPDLTALRFYALIKDQERFEQEKRRIVEYLRRRGDAEAQAILAILLSEAWAFPVARDREECMVAPRPELDCGRFQFRDVGGTPQGPDEREAWALVRAGDLDGARRLVEEWTASFPDYTPNPDLITDINRSAFNAELEGALAAKNWQRVVEIANDPAFAMLFGCANINNEWNYAIALIQIGRREEAFELYKRLVETCSNQQERIATIQKANDAGASTAFIRKLIAIEEARGGSPARVAALRQQLLGGGPGSDGGGGTAGAPSGPPVPSRDGRIATELGRGKAPSAADYKFYVDRAVRLRDTNAAQLLGFYHYNREEFETAEVWFTRAMDWKPSAKAAEGLLLTQRALGRPLLAERIGAPWLGKSREVEKAYDDLADSLLTADQRKRLPDAVLARIETRAMSAGASPRLTLGLGWYHFNRAQATQPIAADHAAAAIKWFEIALTTESNPEDVRASAAEGLALSYLALGRRDQVAQIAGFYGVQYPKVGRIIAEALAKDPGRANEAFSAGDYVGCLRELAPLEAEGPLDAGLSMLKAWCLLGLQRPVEATFMFERARDTANPQNTQLISDAVYGVALATMQRGMITDALTRAEDSGVLDPERLGELRAEGLAQRAVLAFNARRYEETLRLLEMRSKYARARRDLLLLRAWSLYHLGYASESQALFAVLDEQLTTPETREGLRVVGLRRAPNAFYD